jgi:phosphatidate phosphatase APP1
MTGRRGAARFAKGTLRALRLLAKPVRRSQGRAGTVVETYRGYGSRDEVFLIGRVFRQSSRAAGAPDEGWAAELRDIRRRITRRTVPGAVLTARFFGCKEQVVTDRDGYFRVRLRPNLPAPPQASWHSMELDLAGPEPVRAKGQVFIPSAECRRVVISDIDDTIMRTGVANKVKMLWRLFVEDAENRVAFPGAAALYRALYAGPCGAEGNPMLYVSRAPWGIYDMLSEFFVMHRIPVGPVLFLREWGLSWTSPLPRRAEDHKRHLIDHMLALYHDLPFVLIGDSGQHDPEVYAGIVAAHPGRVAAVYIRNVSRDAGRLEEIAKLAEAVEAAGSSLVLAADSLAMAEHAAEHGLIARTAVADVAREYGTVPETRRRADRTRARALRKVLDGAGPTPPNVVVEPSRSDPPA